MSSKKEPVSQTHAVAPEFSHRVSVSTIGRSLERRVEANESEREALCRRFGLVRLDRLVCSFDLTKGTGRAIQARGFLEAQATQACVITAEPVDEIISEAFQLRFVRQEDMPADDDIDLDALLAEEADDVPYDGLAVDLGEAASEQLALALNPYPRRAGVGLEEFVEVTPSEEEEAKIPRDGKPNPFATLAQLKEKKDKQ
ncbi:DUF177 domain-containing protein [Saccharibacter sp. 17.LH.SD]|uniref:YceD family protein n=1 Tax=Saccharibacter sp. 17.LH.SD TaxID=2689393 RepID=UPI00136985F5|nr:DUF177 domain-containing protein [Saccharibacter sp. 17.LH.SD]MXV44629.1 DUF177 domain-containing protein [Saccharibacter sp. 17.LH.SD]